MKRLRNNNTKQEKKDTEEKLFLVFNIQQLSQHTVL